MIFSARFEMFVFEFYWCRAAVGLSFLGRIIFCFIGKNKNIEIGGQAAFSVGTVPFSPFI
jgi:hypothetical protein